MADIYFGLWDVFNERQRKGEHKRPAPAIIPKELEGRKLVGIVHGERVDKAHNITPEVFTVIRFVGRSENVKKKGREFLHAIGHAGGKQYFLVFE